MDGLSFSPTWMGPKVDLLSVWFGFSYRHIVKTLMNWYWRVVATEIWSWTWFRQPNWPICSFVHWMLISILRTGGRYSHQKGKRNHSHSNWIHQQIYKLMFYHSHNLIIEYIHQPTYNLQIDVFYQFIGVLIKYCVEFGISFSLKIWDTFQVDPSCKQARN